MFKAMVLLKRRQGMTLKDFIHCYEATRAPLGVQYQTKMKRYVRHFLHPAPYPLDGVKLESQYDVLTELWFDDRQAYDEGMALMMAEEANRVLSDDAQRLFDISRSRLAFVEEHESELPGNKVPEARTDKRCFVLLKRKPGSTLGQFIDYYENHHQLLGVKYSGEMMSRYRRYFLKPAPNPSDGSIVEPAYDVATECAFPANGNTQMSNDPGVESIIEADEERFIDRSTRRLVVVESHESVLPWVPGSAEGEFVRRVPA